MQQALTELVGRRSKLMASGAWSSYGWLSLKLNRTLRDRSLFLGMVIDGMSNYRIGCELALFNAGQQAVLFSTVLADDYSLLAYSGSSTGWDIGTSGDYSKAWQTTGFPSWRIVKQPEFTEDYSDPGVSDALCWTALTDNGTFKTQHKVTCYPFRVLAEADELRFRFTERNAVTFLSTPSVEIFLGCRSMAIVR